MGLFNGWIIVCSVLFPIIVSNSDSLGDTEYGPKPLDTNSVKEKQSEVISEVESPKDVVSVSKFIKEFHRQFEEKPYLKNEHYDKLSESRPSPKSSLYVKISAVSENVTVNVSETELNSTKNSLPFVNCDSERLPWLLTIERQFEEEPYLENEHYDKLSEGRSSPKSSSSVEISAVSQNVTVNVNETESNSTNNSLSFVNCNSERLPGVLAVELVNSTRLLSLLTTDANITSKTSKADCVVLLFYARTCPFSCIAAPHFNALPRAFPSIKMAAVNVFTYQSFNTQYGIVGVPTVMLLHNGRPAAKFNDSEYTLEMFTRFITKYTGLAPEEKMFVTSADFGGPVPSVLAKETDYWLALAWAVIATVGGVAIGKSRAWRAIVEAIQNTWREAEAQHPHAE